jgi:ATP/ADP translocase/HEAT repeat protein
MRRLVTNLFDLRHGELRPVAQSFLVLFFIISAHTMLETARDALFLTKLPPRQLNLVYIALAALSFVVSAGTTRMTMAFGRRNALVVTLAAAALVTTLLYAMPPTAQVVMALYVFSGLLGATLVLQFWLLAADVFTTAQGRRLFGPIASGGVVGGAAGAAAAMALLMRVSVTTLVIVSAFGFLATALIVTTFDAGGEDSAVSKASTSPSTKPALSLSEHPFVWRVALLVGISTAAVLVVDFLFKSTAAQSVPSAQLPEFFARYYAVMNVASLVVQLFVAGRVVRHLGVAPATAVMPSLLLFGGVASFLSGGALVPALATRVIDGSMRHSLNRVATELLYLPMPPAIRERAKGLIDTVLTRAVQAATAGLLFGLGALGVLSPRVLAGMVAVSCLAWVGVALGMRAGYLDLFRRTLARGTLSFEPGTMEIDVNAVEALVEAMASSEATNVVAAMDILDQRNRARLIPALILHHDAEPVLFRALEIFGASTRDDWIPLGERLLSHESEAVRVAAVRALAKRGVGSALTRAMSDASSSVQAYAAFFLALDAQEDDPASYPPLAAVLDATGPRGNAGREQLLHAIADTKDPRAASLVFAIVERAGKLSPDAVTLVARAMEALNDPRFIPFLVARLASREGRDAIRHALVALGEPALAALEAALVDVSTDRHVRMHIPRTIARFGTQRACDFLVKGLSREPDGFVRYKVLRGIGLMVAENEITVDRALVEREAKRNLVEHLRAMALRVGIDRDRHGERAPSEHLLVGLLRDKERQALERAFRLLKIAHKHEDIHRVHTAAISNDKKSRSNAGEFIDSLLSARGQSDVRELFRLAVDDLEPADRVTRALGHLGDVPRTRDDALAALIEDRDEGLATLASYHALTIGSEPLRAKVERARDGRPSLDTMLQRFLATPSLLQSAS